MTKVSVKSLSLALALGLLSSGPAAAGEPDTVAFVRAVLDELGAEVVSCPDATLPSARERLCAKGASNLHAFRHAWNDYVDRDIKVASQAESVGDWVMGWSACSYRDYRVEGLGLRVTLDHRANMAEVAFGGRSDGSSAIPRAGAAGISEPKVLEEKAPTYPKPAKKNKIHGKVVLEIVVQRDGSVGDVALIWGCPKGWGLEQAAAEAARQWRFEPALRDGVPVDVSTSITVEFRGKAGGKAKYAPSGGGAAPVLISAR
jgi:TonB family protein